MSNGKEKKDYFWKVAVVVILAVLCVQSVITYRVISSQAQKKEKEIVADRDTLQLVPRQVNSCQYQPQQQNRCPQAQHKLTPRALPPLNLNINNLPGIKPSVATQQQPQQRQLPQHTLSALPNTGRVGFMGKDPFDMDMEEEMARMEQMMNAMLSRTGMRGVFPHSGRAPSQRMGFSSRRPPSVSIDKDQNYVVQLQIPGLDKSEIKANVNGNILTVSGVQREEETSSGNGGQSYVSSYSSFQNSFSLPGPAKSQGLKMDYKGDTLTIKIPRA